MVLLSLPVRSFTRQPGLLRALCASVALACHTAAAPTAEPPAPEPAPVAPAATSSAAAPQTVSAPTSAPATLASAAAPAAATPSAPLYLVVYRAGPKWPEGEGTPPVLREHFHYLLALHNRGELKMAGPFAGERGGAAVFHAADDAAARAWLEADPAVRSQVFQFELRRWSPVDWDSLARKR